MVNTSIRLGVALATLFNVAVVTANKNPLSLDTSGGTANDTGFARVLEDENGFDRGSSITDKKKSEKCPTSRLCTVAGGSCIKSNTVCEGRVDHLLCKGKKCKCCITGTSQTEMFNAEHTESENARSLDTTGGTANDTGFLRVLEEENNLDHGNSITERKNCPASRQCTKAGGSCIKSKAICDGRVDHLLCKGKRCKCCTPDHTTPAPSTCPTCPATSTCPTTPTPLTCPTCLTCPAPSTCPTILAPLTCPTCPAPPTCPTTTAPLTCPTCPAPSTCPTTTAPSTCPTCPAPSTCPTTTAPLTCPTCPTCPTTPAPTTCQSCPVSTCEPCPTPAATTTTTPALTTITIPPGFEIFNNRLIRRTISSDQRSYWDTAMNFCDQFSAAPFIPRVANEHDLYKTVYAALGRDMWLPASDRAQEGTLAWYNGEAATNINLWDWNGGQELHGNTDDRDCLHYSSRVYFWYCTRDYYPPICEVL